MMDERKEGTIPFFLVWCFRDLLLSEKCWVCLISEDILHPHHHPYPLGYGNAYKTGGILMSPMRVFTRRYIQGEENTTQGSAVELL